MDYYIPYTGKFSLVQNSMKLLVNPSEEILWFNFCGISTPAYVDWHSSCIVDIHTAAWMTIQFLYPLKFRGSYFCIIQPIRENRDILHIAI